MLFRRLTDLASISPVGGGNGPFGHVGVMFPKTWQQATLDSLGRMDCTSHTSQTISINQAGRASLHALAQKPHEKNQLSVSSFRLGVTIWRLD